MRDIDYADVYGVGILYRVLYGFLLYVLAFDNNNRSLAPVNSVGVVVNVSIEEPNTKSVNLKAIFIAKLIPWSVMVITS